MILKALATIAWIPACVIVIAVAVCGGLLVGAAALMIPVVHWLAKHADQ